MESCQAITTEERAEQAPRSEDLLAKERGACSARTGWCRQSASRNPIDVMLGSSSTYSAPRTSISNACNAMPTPLQELIALTGIVDVHEHHMPETFLNREVNLLQLHPEDAERLAVKILRENAVRFFKLS